jgi:tetratricopeptide (TPR) repeat protein
MTSGTTEAVLARLRAALAGRYQFDTAPGDPPPLIGEGGMAFVYRAHDIRHNRMVAIKVLRPELAAELGIERFLQEIQVAAQLQHPLILPLFDSGDANTEPGSRPCLYYVMPLVQGETLRARIDRERQLPIADALAIVRDVAEALDHAHGHGIVHRDIKPENIFLSGSHAVVADFGIARAVSVAGGPRITSQGVAIGTPEYMSPEQASSGDELDGRSDLYSLGCVLYEMLAGQPPFTGRTAQAIVARHLSERPPSLRVVRPTVPIALERTLETALGKVPADRFTTAGKFATALEQTVVEKRRTTWPLIAAAVLAVVMLGAWLLRDGPARDPQQRDWLLIGDFTSPVADTALADMLRDLVEVELNRSRFVSAMPEPMVRQALRDAGMPESTAVTTERAREVAIRYSVRAVLSGQITSPSPGQYLAVLEAIDAGTGAPIYSTTGPISRDSLAHGAQQLARAMRAGLGERRRSIEAERPLYRVTTPSFEAFRLYRNALDLAVTGNLPGSNRLLQDALAIDTGFAGAWAAMGMNYVSARNLDSAKIAFDQALLRPDRLTDAQRYRLDGDAAYALHHDLDGAIRFYSLFLNEVPTSIGGRNNLALYLSSTGRYEDALAQVDSAIALNPFGTDQAQIELLNRSAMLISLGRRDDASVSLRRLTGPFERYALFQYAAATDDWSWADSTSRRPPDPAEPGFLRFMSRTSGAGARAALGDSPGADRLLAEAADSASGAGQRWYQRARLLLAYAERRPVTWSIAVDSTPAQAMVAGLAAVLAGDTARANRLLDRLEPLDASTRGTLGAGPALLRALLEVRAGRPDSAARRLAPLATVGEHDALSLDRVDSYWLRLGAAEAFAAAGQRDSALHYLQLALNPERMPPSHYALRGLIYGGATRQLSGMQDR